VTAARSFPCRAILFDLDGVLVDSAECIEKTWRKWATDHRLDPEHVIEIAHGRRAIETVRLIAPELSADAELGALAASEAMTSEGVYEITGASELLQQLPAGTWGVVTSGIRSVAEFRLRYTRLLLPAVMICADEIMRGKPDPEGYVLTTRLLSEKMKLKEPLKPSDCLIVEDAPAVIRSVKQVGFPTLAVATSYAPSSLGDADWICESLRPDEVKQKIRELKLDV